ncbi:MAG: CRISPR-associated protein Csx14 [Candidatus Atribacteria bacterium]|nr:CRISPR-associated protein Csx14 [Candidatus Atribacteria bacterium]
MKKVLMATLGESPAVVTEAIDRLAHEGVPIDSVVILTTSDAHARMSLELLQEHIPAYYNHRVNLFDVRRLDGLYDVDSDTAVLKFMEEACSALRDCRKKGWEVYASIAGGRKAMSALFALAVQFYGARRLFHVLTQDPELEEEGRIWKLQNRTPEEQKRLLHPPVETIQLVQLPFVGLFPLLGNIITGLQGGSVSGEVRQILEDNGLVRADKVTDLGKTVLQILQNVESLPEPRQGECHFKFAEKEPKEAPKTREWANRLANRFLFIERVDDIGWREGQPKVKKEPPNTLLIFLPGRRVTGIGFRLTTTARTEGQLNRACQEVEKWIEREIL